MYHATNLGTRLRYPDRGRVKRVTREVKRDGPETRDNYKLTRIKEFSDKTKRKDTPKGST